MLDRQNSALCVINNYYKFKNNDKLLHSKKRSCVKLKTQTLNSIFFFNKCQYIDRKDIVCIVEEFNFYDYYSLLKCYIYLWNNNCYCSSFAKLYLRFKNIHNLINLKSFLNYTSYPSYSLVSDLYYLLTLFSLFYIFKTVCNKLYLFFGFDKR